MWYSIHMYCPSVILLTNILLWDFSILIFVSYIDRNSAISYHIIKKIYLIIKKTFSSTFNSSASVVVKSQKCTPYKNMYLVRRLRGALLACSGRGRAGPPRCPPRPPRPLDCRRSPDATSSGPGNCTYLPHTK